MDLVTLALARKYTDKTIIEFLSSTEEMLGVYKYKGSVFNFSDLPKKASIGDVYNVINEDGLNYAWNGTEWDSLGRAISSPIGEIPKDSNATTVIEYVDEQIVSVVKKISINGELIDITDGVVDIPLATQTTYGLVKSSQNENFISVLEDGSMEINSLNINKLTQNAEEDLILTCGDAKF